MYVDACVWMCEMQRVKEEESLAGLGWLISLRLYELFMGYLMPKSYLIII